MIVEIEFKSVILKTDDKNVSTALLQKLHFPKGWYLSKQKREYLQVITSLQEIKDMIELSGNDIQSKCYLQ